MRRTRFLLLTAFMVAGMALPAAVLGDPATNGQLVVRGDHIDPGQSFTITGFDLDPLIELALSISNGARTAHLGTATVSADGNVSATVTLPRDFPNGYANIVATSAADGLWATSVLVGARAEGPGVPGVAVDSGGPFIDTVAIGLAMVVVGLILFVVAARRFLRGRPKGGAAAR